MRIYFERHKYPKELIIPYLDISPKDKSANESERKASPTAVPVKIDKEGYYVEHIGYIFVSNDTYSGPVFILPKSFLQEEDGVKDARLTVLGKHGIKPESVIDTDSDDNVLVQNGYDYFLPELSLWLFRAIARYREDANKENNDRDKDNIEYITPDDGTRDRDFLSTAVRLMDFLSDHRNLFTQISIINHSGNARTDWHKTISQMPLVKDERAWYLNLKNKNKVINIDEELIRIYYSVLRFLKERYHFPIVIGDTFYDTYPPRTIQRYLDTGVGKRKMQDIRGKYFRDDLKCLWSLLDSFFTFNTSKDNNKPIREVLVVNEFDRVFERMIDHLVGEPDKLSTLKSQKDGKLIDHIYLDRSLIGPDSNIYFIGDSKYYTDGNHPEGEALYKQYTYARNVLQQHITKLYINKDKNKDNLRYRDRSLTEGYNISPNFFIRCRVIKNLDSFYSPEFEQTDWEPGINKHFEDRLFDRDTLLLSEFSINLMYVIAAYGSYEENPAPLRQTIREGIIEMLNRKYRFFKFIPKASLDIVDCDGKPLSLPFDEYFYSYLAGKIYHTIDPSDRRLDVMTLAFERGTVAGDADYARVSSAIRSHILSGSIDQESPLENN